MTFIYFQLLFTTWKVYLDPTKKKQKFIPELNYWQTFGPFKIKMQGDQKPRFNNRG